MTKHPVDQLRIGSLLADFLLKQVCGERLESNCAIVGFATDDSVLGSIDGHIFLFVGGIHVKRSSSHYTRVNTTRGIRPLLNAEI
jgi:hypothetical protein